MESLQEAKNSKAAKV